LEKAEVVRKTNMILEAFHGVLKYQGFNGKRNPWIGYLIIVLQRMLDRRGYKATLYDREYTLPISQWLIKFGEVVSTRCGSLASMFMEEAEPIPPRISDEPGGSFSGDDHVGRDLGEGDNDDIITVFRSRRQTLF